MSNIPKSPDHTKIETSPLIGLCGISCSTRYILPSNVVMLAANQLDPRTNDEIAAQLTRFQPVRQERNVWTFWDKGFDNLSPWVKRNIIGWTRRLGRQWDVRCLDLIPGSPNNVFEYLDADTLPACLVKGQLDGQFSGPHASDLTRLALIFHHGGIWLDTATLLFCDLDDAFWNTLSDPLSPFEFLGLHYPFRQDLGQISTSFFAARKGNPFVHRWMKVFHELWKGRTNCHGLHKHPLIQHLKPLAPTAKQDIGMGSIEGEHKPLFMDYLALNFAFERVRLLQDPSDGWNGLEYFKRHFLLIDALDELLISYVLAPAEQHAQLLALPYEPYNAEDERQVQVRRWMDSLTAKSLAAKFSSSYWQPGMPIPLPKIWQEPGSMDADIAPGTWAEYMRFASENFTQLRCRSPGMLQTLYVDGQFGSLFHGKLLEPIEAQ